VSVDNPKRIGLLEVVTHLLEEPDEDLDPTDLISAGAPEGRYAQVWDRSPDEDDSALLLWLTDDPDEASVEPEEAVDWGAPYGMVDRDTGRVAWPVTAFVWEDDLSDEEG